jgi:hypothetical protein
LGDRKPKKPRADQENSAASASSVSADANMNMAAWGGMNPMIMGMMMSGMAKEWMGLMQPQAQLQQVSDQCPVRKSSLPIIPSSDDSPDFTTDYPRLNDWLRDLDEHATRGRDQQNYIQWASFLMAEGYIRLDDFQQIKSEELHQICEGMNRGTASRLLAYTKEDIERLDKENRRARKRTREF